MTEHPRAPFAGWAPTSPCTPDCLPDRGPVASRVRIAVRAVALIVSLLGAVLGTPVLPARLRDRWLRVCSRACLRSAGVRLRVVGSDRFTEPGSGVLVVANHLSWIDVLVLDAVQPVRVLAKREVREWPVIGGLAARTGALFVDRAELHALPATVAATTDALRAGAVVGVFPEGTTWCGSAAGRFHRAAFQAAIDAGVPVQPVAITLRHADGTIAGGAAFVGDQTLLDSLMRVLRMPELVCELTMLPSIPAGTAIDRRDLARRAGEAVGGVTGVRHGIVPVPVLVDLVPVPVRDAAAA